jgi:magnesium chelatase family protein
MLVKTFSASVQGLQATGITVEVNATRGVRFALVGLPDSAVKESYERITAAIENSGYEFPTRQITINMAPADVRKEGSGFDLPMAIGILATGGHVDTLKLNRYMMVGELSLDGSLQPIRGALPISIKARELGFEGLFVPEANVREAAVVNNLNVYGARHISQVIGHLNGIEPMKPTVIDTRAEFFAHQSQFEFDFADVKGQEQVKRALEIAAAGSHNLIII